MLPEETAMMQAFQGVRIRDINSMLLIAKLISIMQMVGCPPVTKDQLATLENQIRRTYGKYTIDEFCLAFELNSTHKLAEKVEHFQVFSFDYVANVLYLFTLKANEARKITKPKEEPVPQIDPIEVIEYSFQDWRSRPEAGRTFDRVFNPVNVFYYIGGLGLKQWTKEDGTHAKKTLNRIIEHKASKMNLWDEKEYRASWTPEWLKTMAKATAVALWFDEQIKLNKTTLK